MTRSIAGARDDVIEGQRSGAAAIRVTSASSAETFSAFRIETSSRSGETGFTTKSKAPLRMAVDDRVDAALGGLHDHRNGDSRSASASSTPMPFISGIIRSRRITNKVSRKPVNESLRIESNRSKSVKRKTQCVWNSGQQMSATASAGSAAGLGELPEWNLADLYSSMDAPELARDLEKASADAVAFEARWKGTLAIEAGRGGRRQARRGDAHLRGAGRAGGPRHFLRRARLCRQHDRSPSGEALWRHAGKDDGCQRASSVLRARAELDR
jgi:hypothetical protein